MSELEPFAFDERAQRTFLAVKQENKARLAKTILDTTSVKVDPRALFDVQVKRIHEYKRQLLHALGVLDEYLRIVDDGATPATPRVHIFAGKAAPGYYMAKLIIKLINDIAEVVNNDSRAAEHLKVVFLPDYRVSLAEVIIPAADLSEQISTAGTEASGTSNMKFAMNGALTIGTLDGANVEMLEQIGSDNMFIFGFTVDQVRELKHNGYRPHDWYDNNWQIRRLLETLVSGRLSPEEPRIFAPIYDSLMHHDHYLNLGDLPAYLEAQDKVSACYQEPALWSSKAILNIARTAVFSSDRSIREYAEGIWGIAPVPPPIG